MTLTTKEITDLSILIEDRLVKNPTKEQFDKCIGMLQMLVILSDIDNNNFELLIYRLTIMYRGYKK
jgi:hypothetical protein